jgi:hypothetical protein
MREESRIELAVVAHGDGAASQVHDLHQVGVAFIPGVTVLVIAAVRSSHRACGHFDASGHGLEFHRRLRLFLPGVSPHPAVWTSVNRYLQ